MTRNISVGATRNRLEELGYAPTSATHPDRILSSPFNPSPRRASWGEVDDHPAGVFCFPTEANGCSLEDAAQRQIVLLTLTAYLLSDSRQTKAVMSVLEERKLTSGPYVVRPFGDRTYPLRYNFKEPISTIRARLAFDDDDATVVFDQAIPPSRWDYRRTSIGSTVRVALDAEQSQILALDAGEWKQGHLLDTSRRNLPELLNADIREIISDVERARWGARPLAVAKADAAA